MLRLGWGPVRYDGEVVHESCDPHRILADGPAARLVDVLAYELPGRLLRRLSEAMR
jgi:hypothetical protein